MICKKCGQEKQDEEFCKDKAAKSGFKALCRSCNKLKCKSYYESNKHRNKDNNLKRLYKITESEYNQMFTKQGGLCSICSRPENHMGRALSVDHDHKTGKVRGLLCNSCNRGLGLFLDEPERLRKAASYLESIQ